MSVESDKQWSDRYVPAICQIIGPRLLVPAPIERDRNEGADLIVLTARNMTFAARMRRPGFVERYPYQFTVRDSRPTGTTTELEKIRQGFGDWFFYGHAGHGAEATIAAWLLLDLAQLRRFFERRPEWLSHPDGVGRGTGRNWDGTTFRWFDARAIASVSPGVVIAARWPRLEVVA